MKRAFLVQWAGRNGTNRTDTVYSSSLREHWESVAKNDLNPATKYYISVQPFMYRERTPTRIVDVMEPVLSPTESLTGKHYQRLQRMAWLAQNGLSLDVSPPIDVHSTADFATWDMQMNDIACDQDADNFATALMDYYKQRRDANAVMLAAWNGEDQKKELEKHVDLVSSAIEELDAKFKCAFPSYRCIADLPLAQHLVLI